MKQFSPRLVPAEVYFKDEPLVFNRDAKLVRELTRGIDDWEQRLSTALVKSTPSELVRAQPPATASPDAPPQASDRASRKQS